MLKDFIDKGFSVVLRYPDFYVLEDKQGAYYLVSNDTNWELVEVECIATLSYNVRNDINWNVEIENAINSMFDCDVCGECVRDNDIKYLWFKRINDKEG